MFKNQEGFNNSLFGSYAYQSVIDRHQDHLLVRMQQLIDWSFVESEVADCYATIGQHAYHPLIIFKLLILQNLYNLSERVVCEQTDLNIMYRYFIGMSMTDAIPHWTEIGKFKERIGIDAFERLFYRILEEAERLGIEISSKRNADATDIKADVDVARCLKDKKGEQDHRWISRNTSDPDAGFGTKGTAPGSKRWYGYKSHINQDAKTELVTAVETTDASVSDGSMLASLVDKERDARGEDTIRKQGGDKAYVGNAQALYQRGILDYTIPRNNMHEERAQKRWNTHYLHLKHQRHNVERKYAEGKRWHHLGTARYRGRWKVHVQGLLTYLMMNLKRIVTLLLPLQVASQH
ncbi:MAG: transposase [Candidatus Sungbacteria bacterium]|nr:transposase [Candidatus Sungbacteria bacterium]